MLRINIFLVLFLIFLGLGFFAFQFFRSYSPSLSGYQTAKVKVGGVQYLAHVADTAILRAKGLSGRKELKEGEGMLFIFEKEGEYGFWMKDMLFPIDIIWIAGKRVVGFSENLSHEKSQQSVIYNPPEPVDMVLEVSAGQVKNSRIKIGDSVLIEGHED